MVWQDANKRRPHVRLKGPIMTLWVRAGDGDNYNGLDGLHEVADYLAETGATGPLDWCNKYGVTSPEYQGNNYISLYWGDDDAQPIRPLTVAEHNEVNRLLHSLPSAYGPMKHPYKGQPET
jgi:hypothetical protein